MNETFKQQVFEIIKMIPKGRVTTYGAIAKAVGFPNHSRHVGNALRNYDEDFPAHEKNYFFSLIATFIFSANSSKSSGLSFSNSFTASLPCPSFVSP